VSLSSGRRVAFLSHVVASGCGRKRMRPVRLRAREQGGEDGHVALVSERCDHVTEETVSGTQVMPRLQELP
jgi:hypothetical protein